MRLTNQNNLNIEESFSRTPNVTDKSIGFGTNYWNPAVYVAKNEPHNIIPRQIEVTDGWDTVSGDAANESSLIVNDPAEYFYITGQEFALVLDNVHDSQINIETRLCSRAVYLKDCTNIQVRFDAMFCGIGARLSGCNDIEISNSKSSHISGAHLEVKNCSNIRILNNEFDHGCKGESTGGIYMFDTVDSLVEGNQVAFNDYGHYWPYDGGGIYMEHGSTRNKIIGNTVLGSHMALQDNSGGENEWTLNKLIDCNNDMRITNVHNVLNGIPDYRGNILIGTQNTSNVQQWVINGK